MATIDGSSVKKLIVACDAGMGSSVMLASTLKKQLAKSGVTVEHSPVSSIPSDADVVVTQAGLADRRQAVVARRSGRSRSSCSWVTPPWPSWSRPSTMAKRSSSDHDR